MTLSVAVRAGAILCALLLHPHQGVAFIEPEDLDPVAGMRALDSADASGGPLAPDPPAQVSLEENFTMEWNGYRIEAIQGFGIEALVLGRKNYVEGDMGQLVPIDLALAWGQASDPLWVRHLSVEQSDRVYRWSYPRGTPIDQRSFEVSSANMHIMPASPEIRAMLDTVGPGDVVRMSGFLVNISGPGGYAWNTSIVRTDVGLGACEVILVETVEIVGR